MVSYVSLYESGIVSIQIFFQFKSFNSISEAHDQSKTNSYHRHLKSLFPKSPMQESKIYTNQQTQKGVCSSIVSFMENIDVSASMIVSQLCYSTPIDSIQPGFYMINKMLDSWNVLG